MLTLEELAEGIDKSEVIDKLAMKKIADLMDENYKLKYLLKRLEFSHVDLDYSHYCHICGNYMKDGHRNDCELKQLLEVDNV